jgi:hypothetical protein
LFSRDDVCNFVNASFEPVWVSVRPVPIVRIDFGNGRVLTRTLHGNILTSVCTADGTLLDALPGIYTPEVYIDRLDQLRLLSVQLGRQPREKRASWLAGYHDRTAKALAANQQPERFIDAVKLLPVGKGVIERPVEKVLVQASSPRGTPPNGSPPPAKAAQTGVGPEPIAGWKELVQDTELNERTRRRQIHELLAKSGLVRPERVLKPIYKDVLHADLDDPYLGLGKTLFEHYPFAEEDAAK